MPHHLSPAAEELLAYTFQRGGQAPVVFDDDPLQEAVRAGLIELVTAGTAEPFVALTPAGFEHCRPVRPSAAPLVSKVVRAPV